MKSKVLSLFIALLSLSSCKSNLLSKLFNKDNTSDQNNEHTSQILTTSEMPPREKIELNFSSMDSNDWSAYSKNEIFEFEYDNNIYNSVGCCLDKSGEETYLKMAMSDVSSSIFGNAIKFNKNIYSITLVMRGGNSNRSQLAYLSFGTSAFTSPVLGGNNTVGYGQSKYFLAPEGVDFFVLSGYGSIDVQILSISIELVY